MKWVLFFRLPSKSFILSSISSIKHSFVKVYFKCACAYLGKWFSHSGTPETMAFVCVYLGRDSKLTILLYFEQMWVLPALELSVLYLLLLCRFTKELRTRSTGKGGSHRRHDCAALPAAGGSPCCWGERHRAQACSQEGGQSPACSLCGGKACVWHPCPLDPNDNAGEEIVRALSRKRKLPLVYFLVDTKLLLGCLGRIRSMFLLWWPPIM